MSTDKDYQEVLDRLTKYCSQSWIALPIPNTSQLEVFNTETCPAASMKKWLEYVWPPIKKQKIKPSDLSTVEKRIGAMMVVIAQHRLLQAKKN